MSKRAAKAKVTQLPAPPAPIVAIAPRAAQGAVAIPRAALLRLALVLHDIKRSQEVAYAQAA